MPYYLNPYKAGIQSADSLFNGIDINVKWNTAYSTVPSNLLAYNIYYNEERGPDFTDAFFTQSPAFIALAPALSATITDLTPGDNYHFGVRAAEYDPTVFDLSTLPIAFNNLRVLPSSLLSQDIGAADGLIPLIDASEFPATGTIKLGTELINYSSIDSNNNLILTDPTNQRGYQGTIATEHDVDGYNGSLFWDPRAILWVFEVEEQNTQVYQCQSRFDLPNFSYTVVDGYKQRPVDLINTNLAVSDAINQDFPAYDYAGYRRLNPVDLLNGTCVGSYFGGQYGCYDGYTGSTPIRGISVQDRNLQRQELLLNTTGEPVILMKRQWTGVVCSCYIPSQEYPEARCNKCYGTGFVSGYQQYFSDRRSDGKILIRFSPTVDSVEQVEQTGLESVFRPECWGLTIPTIHERDFIIRFDQDGNEEYRYEVINVTRNRFFLTYEGMQKFQLQRVRKTDVIYMVNTLEQTLVDVDGQQGINFLRTLNTSLANGPGFPYHTHTITVSQEIIDPSQVNGITSISQGHSHVILNGVVQDGSQIPGEVGLGHIHNLLWIGP